MFFTDVTNCRCPTSVVLVYILAIKNNDKKSFRSLTYCTYSREISRSLWGWICSKKATPVEASGGEMNGCTDGRWVMGTPYTVSSKVDLPPTTVFGSTRPRFTMTSRRSRSPSTRRSPRPLTCVYLPSLFVGSIRRYKGITCASQCVALVHRDHPTANAAEYSNVGAEWCRAAFDA